MSLTGVGATLLPDHPETMGNTGQPVMTKQTNSPINVITVATSLRACIAPIVIRIDVVQAMQVVQVG